MPESAYYKGHGDAVMADMQKRYGSDKGKRVFYATANAHPAMKPRTPVSDMLSRKRAKKG